MTITKCDRCKKEDNVLKVSIEMGNHESSYIIDLCDPCLEEFKKIYLDFKKNKNA